MNAHQAPLPPAGILAAVPVERFPAFPASPLDRIRWAMNASIANPPAKHVLLLLAVYADCRGMAWPSLASLEADTAMGRSTIKRAIGLLVERGWLTRYDRTRRSTVYMPKATWQRHCVECWRAVPVETQRCPVCGHEQGRGPL